MIYSGLYEVIGKRKISKFIENLVRPHVIDKSLDNAYREMSKDETREKEAIEWSENLLGDIRDEQSRKSNKNSIRFKIKIN